jgi:hypothetical protein
MNQRSIKNKGETTMQRLKKATLILLIIQLLALSGVNAQTLGKKQQGPQAANGALSGGGTPGRISKWAGVSGSSTYVLGDSNIFEDKFGKVGIGTTTPTSLLTVAGMIETTLGGVKFPDGTVQTTAFNPNQVVRSLNGLQGDLFIAAGTNITVTPSGGNTLTIAAPNVLTAVTHNATLTGNGTAASPLGIANGGVDTVHLADNSVKAAKIAPGSVGNTQLADNAVTAAKIAPNNVVKSLNGLKDDVVLTAGSNITLTPNGNTIAIASTVSNPDQNAFQKYEFFQLPNEQNDFIRHVTLPVPAGKRLVIEYFAIALYGDGECQPLRLITTFNGNDIENFYELPKDGGGLGKTLDKHVKIYADSNVNLEFVNSSGGNKGIKITVTGYYVDQP